MATVADIVGEVADAVASEDGAMAAMASLDVDGEDIVASATSRSRISNPHLVRRKPAGHE